MWGPSWGLLRILWSKELQIYDLWRDELWKPELQHLHNYTVITYYSLHQVRVQMWAWSDPTPGTSGDLETQIFGFILSIVLSVFEWREDVDSRDLRGDENQDLPINVPKSFILLFSWYFLLIVSHLENSIILRRKRIWFTGWVWLGD